MNHDVRTSPRGYILPPCCSVCRCCVRLLSAVGSSRLESVAVRIDGSSLGGHCVGILCFVFFYTNANRTYRLVITCDNDTTTRTSDSSTHGHVAVQHVVADAGRRRPTVYEHGRLPSADGWRNLTQRSSTKCRPDFSKTPTDYKHYERIFPSSKQTFFMLNNN